MSRRGMKSFNMEEKKKVDLAAAMSIYRSAIPFTTLSNPCNDHSSYRVDGVPIDFHEFICVDT